MKSQRIIKNVLPPLSAYRKRGLEKRHLLMSPNQRRRSFQSSKKEPGFGCSSCAVPQNRRLDCAPSVSMQSQQLTQFSSRNEVKLTVISLMGPYISNIFCEKNDASSNQISFHAVHFSQFDKLGGVPLLCSQCQGEKIQIVRCNAMQESLIACIYLFTRRF